MICYFCGAKILDSVISKQFRKARITSSRFIYFYHCNKCNKYFDYRHLKKHKELFRETLTLIQF